MTDQSVKPDPAAESAKLFASFIARRATGEAIDFDSLRAEAPQFASELQALEVAWERVGEVLEQLGIANSVTRRAGGVTQAAPVAGRDAGDTDVAHEVVDRLSHRSASFTRYLVKGEVARGGMGSVLRVWDSDLRRDLAMKVVLGQTDASKESEVDPRVLTRFIEEAQVTGQLDHPGIVPVHELGIDSGGRVYFTMRLVAGRDLEAIFKLVHEQDEDWTQTGAVGVLLKVCQAMAYAHSKSVVHRDLKPANIMVGRFGEVYVMDWGLAHVFSEVRKPSRGGDTPTNVFTDLQAAKAASHAPQVTMDGDVVGTPAYMSPEQAKGDTRAVGPLSDVYSAGAILYHLLSGEVPYVLPGEKPTAFDVWKKVREGPPAPIHERAPAAPAELSAVCEKAMAREADDRYSSMQELAEDLRDYLEGRVVHAYEAGAIAEFRKWVRRNKALAWTASLAIFLVTVGSTTASLVLADKNEELQIVSTKATRSAILAERRADEVLRLSDVKRVTTLRETADLLWPPLPQIEGELEDWLTDARAAMNRLSLHAATLETLRERASSRDPWTFESTEDQWQHDTLTGLVSDLGNLADPGNGLIADVKRRYEFASSVEERSRSGPEASRLWEATIASIRNRGESPAYDGLELTPQLGLLPLDKDPSSGLFEFAHLQSGSPAERDARGGLRLNEATGIVLVLIPGGTFWMGAQADDENERNYSAQATEKEIPPHAVTLGPFFISKYELTQGQWLRTTGSNPSLYGPDTLFGEITHNLLHPAEQISWDDTTFVAKRLALVLPTEAQWEYACRAMSSTPWFTGLERDSLEYYANLADQSVARAGEDWPTLADWPELDDGYPLHAPVGSFLPNAFGLHDMAGNVWEWCRDSFGFYDSPVSGDDALREPTHPAYRINRGGSYYHTTQHARSSHRNNSAPETRQNHLGARLARAIEK